MAMTYLVPDDADLKAQMTYTCDECGQRRTVDAYDEPSVASCIAEGCENYFVIPAYPTTLDDIEEFDTENEARERYNELL